MANLNKRLRLNQKKNEEIDIDGKQALAKKERLNAKKHKASYLAKAGIIAAVYVGLTYLCMAFSYGMIQFRISEILVALIFFEPATLPGLTIGCFIANLMGPGGFYDAVLGTVATSFGLYCIKWLCERGKKPWMGLGLYSLINGTLISFMLSYTADFNTNSSFVLFFWVTLGEVVCAGAGGMLLYTLLKKRWKDIIGETAQSEES